MFKRKMSRLLMGAFLLAPFAQPASAQFPERPIQIVVGLSAGGAQDIAARIIANKMGEVLGQQVVVENRPGDSTNIAAIAVRESPADGYTLYVAGHSNAVNPSLRDNVPIDILNDFVPIALWVHVPNVLVANPSLGVSTLDELIELARSRPEGLFYSSSGAGSVSHLSGAYLAHEAGITLTEIPYRGSGDAIQDLLAGQTHITFGARSATGPHIAAGTLVPLAVTTGERLTGLEDVPTVSESGLPGFEASIWLGLVAPAGTPDDVIVTLREAVDAALEDPDTVARLDQQGMQVFQGDGEDFWNYMRASMDRWAVIIEEAGITLE